MFTNLPRAGKIAQVKKKQKSQVKIKADILLRAKMDYHKI